MHPTHLTEQAARTAETTFRKFYHDHGSRAPGVGMMVWRAVADAVIAEVREHLKDRAEEARVYLRNEIEPASPVVEVDPAILLAPELGGESG